MNNRPANTHAPANSGGNSQRNGNPASGPAKKRNLLLPVLLILTGCAVFMFAAWSAVRSPVLASILNRNTNAQQFDQRAPGDSYAQVYLAKPTYTPAAGQPVAQQVQPVPATATPEPITLPEQDIIVAPPTDVPATEAVADVLVLPTATVEAVAQVDSAPAVAEAAIVPDTPTPEYVAPTDAPYVPPAVSSPGNGVRWFDVDLSDQRMYAYEGDTLVRTFVVSTGTWQTPTLTGRFKVWVKLRSAPMSGPGYYLPNVPHIMYYDGDYGIHGAYWHNNFGVPMSHGCINLSLPDAEWAYDFASVGTVVNIHE